MNRGGSRPGAGRRPKIADATARTIRLSSRSWAAVDNEARIWGLTPSQVLEAVLFGGLSYTPVFLEAVSNPASPIHEVPGRDS